MSELKSDDQAFAERASEAALACVRAGVSVIPVDHTTKRPLGRWNHRRDEIADEATVTSWFREGGAKSFAVVGGQGVRRALDPGFRRAGILPRLVEALAVLLKAAPRGLLLAREELSGWFGGFDAYRGGQGADAAQYLEMHGARAITVDRKTGGRPVLYIPHAALSLTGTIHPGILRRALGDKNRQNGLAARLLVAQPPKKRRRWTELELAPSMKAAVDDVFGNLLALQFDRGDNGGPAPRCLPLTPGAKAAFVEYYDAHAEEQHALGGDLAAAWSKLEGYAARLALVVHLVRAAAADPSVENEDQVDEGSIRAGICLSRWFGNEARRLYGMLNKTEEDRDRRRLLEFIRTRPDGVTCRDLMRAGPCYNTADEADQRLRELVARGLGAWVNPERMETGRPADRRFVLHDSATLTEPPTAD